MRPDSSSSSDSHYNGFWPVFLLGLSLVLVLSWEIQVGVFTRHNTEQLREQQLHVVDQAKKVQNELEKIVRGLVELAKTDDAAAQIVTKYGIKLNNPAMPTETPAP
ncbi:MAG: hypothetical protein H0X40_18220 [Chthoniobacterales bacterium]|nr:hypothetical protein [Chthoniobacterales bacterium]